MQAQRMDGLLGKIVAHQPRRLDPQGQPVRRQGRRAAGDLVARPPQHPVGGAPSRRPASSGRSSTAPAAATRSTSPARARTTAGRPSPTASSIAAARSPAASSSRPAWSSRSTTGTRSSAPSGMAFYTANAVPGVEGQPVHRRPRHARSGAADARGREGDRRGAPADRPQGAHPRRAPGPRRRASIC